MVKKFNKDNNHKSKSKPNNKEWSKKRSDKGHGKNLQRRNGKFGKQISEEVPQSEITTSDHSKDNFFDFDTNTTILNKLQGVKNKNSHKVNSWDYSKVITSENEQRKLRNAQKEQENGKAPRKYSEEDEKMDIENEDHEVQEEEYNMNIDKFESDLFAKNLSFCDFNFSKLILKGLADLEYFHPTKVQEKVIPIILRGNDVLVNAETGSGKTACFLLPIIQKIISNKNSKTEIKSLIILPTRELALQCSEMLQSFTKHLEGITYVLICGGMSIETQINQLKITPDIIIATPGRLIDMLYNYKSLSLESINILVLDEADKLLELGFKDAIIELLNLIKDNHNRQTLLFSATLNLKVADLSKYALKSPAKIKMASSAILSNLKQNIIRMRFKKPDTTKEFKKSNNEEENTFEKRMSYLIEVLQEGKKKRTIVFFNTKKDCHKAYIILKQYNLLSAELHADIQQTDRIKSLDQFQKGLIPYLLATDIAGRGIDIEKVRYVINFQMPLMSDRYIHRIGRTARKGYLGEAITICDENDRQLLKKLIKKEKFTLNVINIENNKIKQVYKNLLLTKPQINELLAEDEMEKELDLAELDVEKAMNIKMHSDEIHNRPKKQWFQTKRQKRDIQKKMKAELITNNNY